MYKTETYMIGLRSRYPYAQYVLIIINVISGVDMYAEVR